jgi:hypothetical protein
MTTPVAFSLGVSHLLFLMLASTLLGAGVGISTVHLGASPSHLMRAGSFVAAALVLAYTGRRYYWALLCACIGQQRGEDVPRAALWAARGLLPLAALSVGGLVAAGLGLDLALIYVSLCLMMFVVLSRIVAETGNFFVQVQWGLAGVVTTLLGFEAVGPTAFVVMALATHVVIPDFRETLMPYLSNGLAMVDDGRRSRAGRAAPWLALMVIAGFFVAGVVTFYVQYNYSVLQADDQWGTHWKPRRPFEGLLQLTSRASIDGTLSAATEGGAGIDWSALSPTSGAFGWLGLGVALVWLVSAARLRLSWWP